MVLRFIAFFFVLHMSGPIFSAPARQETSNATAHNLIRRITVFPIQAPTEFKKAAEDAWWEAREELTQSRGFLLASRQFMLKNEVFQARSELEMADAILLGRLLDTHVLITAWVVDREFMMVAYDGTQGLKLWRQTFKLNPSLPVAEQLPGAARRLIRDFVASIPYQGHQIINPTIGTAVYEEGDVKLAVVSLPPNSRIQSGDVAQWIRLTPKDLSPLFESGQIFVYAEGRVASVDDDVATIEILRGRLDQLNEFSLVRFPTEAERLKKEFSIREVKATSLEAGLLHPEAEPLAQVRAERKPLVTTGSILGSLAAFLLLAL